MKAKTQFMRIYHRLPKKARTEFVYNFTNHPMTLQVLSLEVRNDTKLSKKILKYLGFEDT